ncbi:MAG TPA: hypothetical protein VFF30_00415 [Nitrososphaerales archaeon]|nr:hypothetical protein [Nitrososphaerales archaeon]
MTATSALEESRNLKRNRLIWALPLSIGYPLAILLPYYLAFFVNRVSLETTVPFEFINGLLTTSGILFGFSSLIIISKEWVDRRVWTVILPPLGLLIASGVAIGNLALGYANPVEVLVLSSSTFNANVVSTGFIVGYVVHRIPYRSSTKRE